MHYKGELQGYFLKMAFLKNPPVSQFQYVHFLKVWIPYEKNLCLFSQGHPKSVTNLCRALWFQILDAQVLWLMINVLWNVGTLLIVKIGSYSNVPMSRFEIRENLFVIRGQLRTSGPPVRRCLPSHAPLRPPGSSTGLSRQARTAFSRLIRTRISWLSVTAG